MSQRAPLHSLLKRQLRKHELNPSELQQPWSTFLAVVNEAYHQFDEDREMLEKSLDLTSHELVERNRQLRQDIQRREEIEEELEQRVRQRTEELRRSNEKLQQEIERRKQIEESLEDREHWMRGIFTSLDEAVLVYNQQHELVNMNPAAEAMFGWRFDEVEGSDCGKLHISENAHHAYQQRAMAAFEKGQSLREELQVRRRNGNVFPAEHLLSVLADEDGAMLGAVAVYRDITDRKTEERIREVVSSISEAALEAISLEQLIGVIHKQLLTLLEAKNFYVALYDEASGTYSIPYDRDEGGDELEEQTGLQLKGSLTDWVRRSGKPLLTTNREVEALRKKGEIDPPGAEASSWLGVPLRSTSGTIGVVATQSYDDAVRFDDHHLELFSRVSEYISRVIERHQSDAALKASEERNRALLNAIPDSMFLLDGQGVFLDFHTPTPEKLAASPGEFIGKGVREILGSELGDRTMRAIEEASALERPYEYEYSLEIAGEQRYFDARMVASGQDEYLAIVRDITAHKHADEERRNLEAQIQHSQKLESLGVLAGGIAHDFNNLLVGILGNANLAATRLAPESPAQDLLDRIQSTAMRAADLTKQLLAYSGKGAFVVEAIDLESVIREMTHLLEVSISKTCVLRYDFSANVPAIEADATQIRQIVMNLITNASEAIGERSGIISLRTGVMELDGSTIAGMYHSEESEPGYYSFVEISDTGSGMPEEVQEKMFDPFFTTKFTGRGLGLAAVLGIVRSHKGMIKVYSEAGKGTTIKVFFPCSEEQVKTVMKSGETESDEAHEEGTILVVDDDDSVRNVAKMMYEEYGYHVITAVDGREGLKIFQQRRGEIDMVLLDMTMPHMNGEETFKALRDREPKVKVLLSSGYNEMDATNRFAGKGLAGFIQKPYQLEELIRMTRAIIKGG